MWGRLMCGFLKHFSKKSLDFLVKPETFPQNSPYFVYAPVSKSKLWWDPDFLRFLKTTGSFCTKTAYISAGDGDSVKLYPSSLLHPNMISIRIIEKVRYRAREDWVGTVYIVWTSSQAIEVAQFVLYCSVLILRGEGQFLLPCLNTTCHRAC